MGLIKLKSIFANISGSPSSDGFTEAVTQVDRTTVYSSGAGDGLQDKEDR